MGTDGQSPTITVALPVYNAGRFLRPAVLSIVRQTWTDWELLILDDGSSDDSLASIGDIHDQRIHVIRDEQNKGLAARLNEAIDLAKGRYFARMDQDDISFPERFARQIEMLNGDPSLDLVGARSIVISDNDEILGEFPFARTHEELCAAPWRGFYLVHPTWFGKIEWFRRHRYAKPGPYFCEDQELLLRSYRTSRFGTVTGVVFAYRIHGRLAWRKLLKTRWTVLTVQAKHFMKARQPVYLLFAVATYLIRLSMDLLNRMNAMRHGRMFVRYRMADTDPSNIVKWRDLIRSYGA